MQWASQRLSGFAMSRSPPANAIFLENNPVTIGTHPTLGLGIRRRDTCDYSDTRNDVGPRNLILKGVSKKKREEGGQVPRSVRIQAPARQRGSVSP